jgi:hypothetical protein
MELARDKKQKTTKQDKWNRNRDEMTKNDDDEEAADGIERNGTGRGAKTDISRWTE